MDQSPSNSSRNRRKKKTMKIAVSLNAPIERLPVAGKFCAYGNVAVQAYKFDSFQYAGVIPMALTSDKQSQSWRWKSILQEKGLQRWKRFRHKRPAWLPDWKLQKIPFKLWSPNLWCSMERGLWYVFNHLMALEFVFGDLDGLVIYLL